MRGRRNAFVKIWLILSAAWSAVGMQIHVGSGPLPPESCLLSFCRLFHDGPAGHGDAAVPLWPSRTAPKNAAPVDDEEEDAAESPLSILKATCPSQVVRNHQRRLRREGARLVLASRAGRISAPSARFGTPDDRREPPADSSFHVCRLLF